MKKILLLCGAVIIATLWSQAQAPDWMWARGAGNMSYDAALTLDLDAAGNSYVAGYFNTSIEFDTYNLSSAGSGDIYLVKYDPDGNVLWAVRAGGSSDEKAAGVSVDADGNCYVTGYFKSTEMLFEDITLTNASINSYDMFLAKYDPDGNIEWAIRNGGTGDDRAYAVAVDSAGSCMVAGYYVSPTMQFGVTTLMNSGNVDLFMAKYDPNGVPLWARSATGTGPDYATAITIDKYGNTLMTGYFTSATLTFGTEELDIANVSFSDIFIVKYNPLGDLLWAQRAGGNLTDIGTAIAVDTFGNCFVGGTFKSPTLTFGGTTLTNLTTSAEDMFFAKFDPLGNVQWAIGAGGSKADGIYAVATDDQGTGYMAGYFKSEALSIGGNSMTNTMVDLADIFVAAINLNGIPRWSKSNGSVADDYINALAVEPSGESYIAGNYGNTITFGADVLNCAGTSDMFVAKSDLMVDIDAFFTSGDITIYPVPCNDVLFVTLTNAEPCVFTLFDISGHSIMEHEFTGSASFNTGSLPAGVYIYEVTQQDRLVGNGKISKQ